MKCVICGKETLKEEYSYCINCYSKQNNSNKENYSESKIKGTIAEVIVEELFRKLGFFVLKLGKEMTVNPINQIEEFIKKTSGNFKLEKEDEFIKPVSYINKLPDFVIINKNGEVELLEVKFRKNSMLFDKDKDLFDLYPTALLLIVNLEVPDEVLKTLNLRDENLKKELKNTRFHICEYIEDRHIKGRIEVGTLASFLERDFDINNRNLIKEYEDLVVKWLDERK